LLIAFVPVTELRPIKVPRGDEVAEITPSAAFAFALLLVAGPLAAALGLGISAVVADLAGRKAWRKVIFNAAQYAVSLLAGAATLAILARSPFASGLPHISARNLPAVLIAGLVFSVTNLFMTELAIALSQGHAILTVLVKDLVFELSTAGVFVAMAPLAVVLADRSLALVPMLAVPLAAIYKNAATSMEKDYLALHDILTGLPNRALFRDRVEQAMASGRREGACHGVMIIDLNRFKEVNDTLGHHIGDLVLQEIGPRLAPLLRASDTVARFGGDEFAVLARDLGSPDEAEAIAGKLVEALQQPFEIKDMSLDIDGSVGIAMFPEQADDVDLLIQRADVAMYRAKKHHEGWETYSADQDQYSLSRLVLVGDLRRALESDDLVLAYQPKVDLATGAATGVEALVRWAHPTRGMVLPDEFIPLAERTGMMRPLTVLVLDKALRQCREWREAGLDLRVAVNISAKNLQDVELPAALARLLAGYEVPPSRLELEITESALMADPDQAMGILLRLHQMGITLTIDDFGTGYSSLTYLRRLPVDGIKIDKSFITNLTPDSDDAIIVQSTVDMARSLGLGAVAEGVESQATMDYLRGIACQGAQGYFISLPRPGSEIAGWMDRWHAGLASQTPIPTNAPLTDLEPLVDPA
jgi:diguanylate cyclase (GGDEF)-like protein